MKSDLWFLTAISCSLLLIVADKTGLVPGAAATVEVSQAQGGSFSLLTLAVLAGIRRWCANRCRVGKTTVDTVPLLPADGAQIKPTEVK